jgi:hypothetical protein
MLGAFDGACYQLRIEHNIQGIITGMPDGFLPATVNFYRITQGLESMERKPDRQYPIQKNELGAAELIDIADKKIIVFKNSQQGDIGNNTYDEPEFFVWPAFYEQSCRIINSDQKEQDQ